MENNKYTINQVSRFLNLSKEMIRYYEKQGVIEPDRNSSNNYRTYNIQSIFWLLEARQYKNLGINISDIPLLRTDGYISKTTDYLDELLVDLKSELDYKNLLFKRISQLKERFSLAETNQGNHWVKLIPAYYTTRFVNRKSQEFHEPAMSEDISNTLFSDKINPFLDCVLRIHADGLSWDICIEEAYANALQIPIDNNYKLISSSYALCTNVDIGDSDDLLLQDIFAFADYCKKSPYRLVPSAPITASLICRGISKGHMQRIFEMRCPIII